MNSNITVRNRLGGLSFLISGFLYAINGVFHFDNNDPLAPFSPYWLPIQLVITIFYVLCIPGLAALRARQAINTGKLGTVGHYLALMGSIITFFPTLGFALVIPEVATQQLPPQAVPELIGPDGPLAWIGWLTLGWIFFFIPGFILTGIATLRARVLTPWAGGLIALGMLLNLIGTIAPLLGVFRNLGGLLAGVGISKLGYDLWIEK